MTPIIVDTNIVFSSILNPRGNIGDILFNNNSQLTFYSPQFLREEIDKLRPKILKASQTSEDKIDELIYLIFHTITFIDDIQIPFLDWKDAAQLVRDIDMDDLPFLALTLFLDGYFWTGDLKLLKGIRKKGFSKMLTTKELLEKINEA